MFGYKQSKHLTINSFNISTKHRPKPKHFEQIVFCSRRIKNYSEPSQNAKIYGSSYKTCSFCHYVGPLTSQEIKNWSSIVENLMSQII